MIGQTISHYKILEKPPTSRGQQEASSGQAPTSKSSAKPSSGQVGEGGMSQNHPRAPFSEWNVILRIPMESPPLAGQGSEIGRRGL